MQPAYVPIRLPETLTAPEIGAEMARLRVQFGLTPHEVSERLHIRPRYISAIEEGKFEQLPGKVYARGYIHTYAEFLGLDADQVVLICFAAEAAVPVAPPKRVVIAFGSNSSIVPQRSKRLYYWLGALLLAGVAASQLFGRGVHPDAESATVSPVPEDMLQSMRNLVMPNAQNYECLTGTSELTCINNDATSRLLNVLDAQVFMLDPSIDLTEIDLTSDTPPVVEEAAPAAQEDVDGAVHEDEHEVENEENGVRL